MRECADLSAGLRSANVAFTLARVAVIAADSFWAPGQKRESATHNYPTSLSTFLRHADYPAPCSPFLPLVFVADGHASGTICKAIVRCVTFV